MLRQPVHHRVLNTILFKVSEQTNKWPVIARYNSITVQYFDWYKQKNKAIKPCPK